MTETEKNWLQSRFFYISELCNQLWLPVAHFWVKKPDWTGLDLWTLISPEVISAIRATAYLFCDKPDQECCVLSRCWWWRTKKNLFLFWERKNGLICSEPLWARSRKSGSALAQVWLGSSAHLLGAELVATLYQPNRYTNSVFFIGSSGLLSSHC